MFVIKFMEYDCLIVLFRVIMYLGDVIEENLSSVYK